MSNGYLIGKIGGTTMSNFLSTMEGIILNDRLSTYYSEKFGEKIQTKIFVVSAFAGLTDKLIGFCEQYKKSQKVNFSLKDIVSTVNEPEDLILRNMKYLEVGFERFRRKIFKTPPEELLPLFIEYGELLTVDIVSCYVSSLGHLEFDWVIPIYLDERKSCNFFSNTSYLPIYAETNRVRRVHIVPGFSRPDIYKDYGRGYSEGTLIEIASSVGASDVVVFKDDPLYSADPRVVDKGCRKIDKMGYDVAFQLADVGMKAFNPVAMKKAIDEGITIHIQQAFDSANTTIIEKDGGNKGVEVVSGSDSVAIVEISSYEMQYTAGFEESLTEYLKEKNISYIMKSTDATSITFIFFEKDLGNHFFEPKVRGSYAFTQKEGAIVSVVGSDMDVAKTLYRSASALDEDGVKILALSSSLQGKSVQFVVSREDYKKSVNCLHRKLIEWL